MVHIIGGGKLGKAIVSGLLRADPAAAVTIVVRKSSDIEPLQSLFPTAAVVSDATGCRDVVLCVKPKDIADAARMVGSAGARRVLSVAAGVTTQAISAACGKDVAVVRSMPNVGAQLGMSATGFCAGPFATEDDLLWAEALLRTLGDVVRVDESHMDAVTGVSGSGIAFVLLTLEALIDAGTAAGLPRLASERLAISTLQGAAALVGADETPEHIRARVTTPGGTTEAGLAVLQNGGLHELFANAVEAAAHRAAELGRTS